MQAEGIEHELPPCDAAYLADYLWEIGPSLPAGMGAGPITHSEIASWQHNTGIELNSWESRTLRKLSITYLNESHKAKDRKCPAPWGESHAVTNLEAATLKNSIRALAEL